MFCYIIFFQLAVPIPLILNWMNVLFHPLNVIGASGKQQQYLIHTIHVHALESSTKTMDYGTETIDSFMCILCII